MLKIASYNSSRSYTLAKTSFLNFKSSKMPADYAVIRSNIIVIANKTDLYSNLILPESSNAITRYHCWLFARCRNFKRDCNAIKS